MCDFRPLLPLVQDIWLEASLVCTDISSDGKKSPVHLDLASDEQAIPRSGPCGVKVLESVNGRVEVGTLCQSLLHGTFDRAVRESEAARQSQRLGYDVYGVLLGHCDRSCPKVLAIPSSRSVMCLSVTTRKSSSNELGCETHMRQSIDTAQGADLDASPDTSRL